MVHKRRNDTGMDKVDERNITEYLQWLQNICSEEWDKSIREFFILSLEIIVVNYFWLKSCPENKKQNPGCVKMLLAEKHTDLSCINDWKESQKWLK